MTINKYIFSILAPHDVLLFTVALRHAAFAVSKHAGSRLNQTCAPLARLMFANMIFFLFERFSATDKYIYI